MINWLTCGLLPTFLRYIKLSFLIPVIDFRPLTFEFDLRPSTNNLPFYSLARMLQKYF